MKTKSGAISKARQYAKSHMWCTFAAVIGAAVLLLLLVLLFYMRGQYYSFLLRTTYSTQEALLDTVEENLERLLDSYVATGSGLCVDREMLYDTDLRAAIDEYVESPRGAGDNQRIKNALKIAGNVSNRIICVAVADADGILCQNDKIQISSMTRIDI